MHRIIGSPRWAFALITLIAILAADAPPLAHAQDGTETGAVTHLPDVVVLGVSSALQPPLPGGAPLNSCMTGSRAGARLGAQDAAGLLADMPGAAVVRNGPQTGIVQLRGLSGDRIRIDVDGRTLSPACPNHMDPPLHYAAPSGADTLLVMAGITPVSLGGDSLGGTVLVLPPPPPFTTNAEARVYGNLRGEYRSANDGVGAHARAGVAGPQESATYAGSWQTANDLRSASGRVRDTGYETQQHGVEVAARRDGGVWSVDADLLRTRDAGTPALPMDMIEDDGAGIGLKHAGDYDWGLLQARVYQHTIDHLMDNYHLRPVALTSPRMRSPAESDDSGASLDATIQPGDAHTVRSGASIHHNAFDAYQQHVATGARQDTLNDARRTRAGAYAEWQADWRDAWSALLGVRGDAVMSEAGAIEDAYPSGAQDAARFNASDRDTTDVGIDAAALLRYRADPNATYEVGVARKTRAPSLLERYLWTPLSASAGQADGRTYVGDLDLDPETAHQLAATADWHGSGWQLRVSPFYQQVENYIQGTPTDRQDAMQRPVLQFTNLDQVELYGADGLARYDLTDSVRLGATVSYVRGRDLDTHDNLYRLAPLRGALELDYHPGPWNHSAQVVLADDQDDVSRYNGEKPTDGYALLHLRTGYRWAGGCELGLGVENVFDTRYADHLGGINRVGDSDVAIGEHLPGAGRSLVASLQCPF
jgi:iron complex outermembrane receptor protein